MTLFRHSAVGFAELTLDGTLAVRIAEQMRYLTGRRPAPAELRSWQRSLPILAQDLIQAGLDNVAVLIEHHLCAREAVAECSTRIQTRSVAVCPALVGAIWQALREVVTG